MKKTKKFLSGILVMAMVFISCASTAFATGSVIDTGLTKTVSSDKDGFVGEISLTELSFTKIFTNEKGGILPDVDFKFTMKPDTSIKSDTVAFNKANYPIKQGIALKNDTVTISYDAFSDSEKTGKFSLETTSPLTGPAAYRYIIKEVVPITKSQINPITYDKSEYIVDLVVDENNNIIYVESIKSGDKDNVKRSIVFENSCSADDLVIKKEVTGSLGDTDAEFKFTLDIPKAGDNITLSTNTIKGIIKRAKGTTETVTITVGTPFDFTLKDGESLVIEGVPEGMIYKVTEDEKSAKDYSTTITCTTHEISGNTTTEVETKIKGKVYNASKDGGQGTPIVDGGNTVVFTNNKEYNADTGIRVDMIPYLTMFMIAIAGVSLFIFRLKRKWAA